jgi:hypothetical protein
MNKFMFIIYYLGRNEQINTEPLRVTNRTTNYISSDRKLFLEKYSLSKYFINYL